MLSWTVKARISSPLIFNEMKNFEQMKSSSLVDQGLESDLLTKTNRENSQKCRQGFSNGAGRYTEYYKYTLLSNAPLKPLQDKFLRMVTTMLSLKKSTAKE